MDPASPMSKDIELACRIAYDKGNDRSVFHDAAHKSCFVCQSKMMLFPNTKGLESLGIALFICISLANKAFLANPAFLRESLVF